MTVRYPVLFFVCTLVGCSSSLKHYFPDEYFARDRTYTNRPLGFALTYIGSWEITTDPARMRDAGKKVARELQQTGRELLFLGATVEGTQGTRGIAANLNLTNDEYLAQIRTSNGTALEEDFGAVDMAGGDRIFKKWEYRFAGLRFVEFLFTTGTYNVRVAFWSDPETYTRFLPVYEEIMLSLVEISPL